MVIDAPFLSGLQDIIATGGADATAVIFDRPSGQIASALSGHSKKVVILLHLLLYLCFLVKLMNDNIIFIVGNQCEICG